MSITPLALRTCIDPDTEAPVSGPSYRKTSCFKLCESKDLLRRSSCYPWSFRKVAFVAVVAVVVAAAAVIAIIAVIAILFVVLPIFVLLFCLSSLFLPQNERKGGCHKDFSCVC